MKRNLSDNKPILIIGIIVFLFGAYSLIINLNYLFQKVKFFNSAETLEATIVNPLDNSYYSYCHREGFSIWSKVYKYYVSCPKISYFSENSNSSSITNGISFEDFKESEQVKILYNDEFENKVYIDSFQFKWMDLIFGAMSTVFLIAVGSPFVLSLKKFNRKK